MPRCIAPPVRGTVPCGGEIHGRDSDDLFVCATCRRIYAAGDLIFVARINAYDEMLAAKKEQEQTQAREERKAAAKKSGRVFS